jgi:hypothetical protein
MSAQPSTISAAQVLITAAKASGPAYVMIPGRRLARGRTDRHVPRAIQSLRVPRPAG